MICNLWVGAVSKRLPIRGVGDIVNAGEQARNQGRRWGAKPPLENFSPPWNNV